MLFLWLTFNTLTSLPIATLHSYIVRRCALRTLQIDVVPNSQFPIPNSQFPIPNSQFPIIKFSANLIKFDRALHKFDKM